MTPAADLAAALRYMMDVREIECQHKHHGPDALCAKCRAGDRELVEDSWRDDFWGWGPNRDGKNMLGKLWMELRAALAQEGGEG